MPSPQLQLPKPPTTVSYGPLSARERQVLTWVGHGYTNDEIAARLHLTINSVKTYVRGAYRKIGATSRSQAVLWAICEGVVEMPSGCPVCTADGDTVGCPPDSPSCAA